MNTQATSNTTKTGSGGVLAMVQVPMQEWKDIYEPPEALKAGTIFGELDKPFFGGDKRG